MKKVLKSFLAALLIIPCFIFAACAGASIESGTYKLYELKYDGHTYSLSGEIEEVVAQLEENLDMSDPSNIGIGITLVLLHQMFGGLEMEVSSDEITFTMSFDLGIPGVPATEETHTIKYSLDGNKIIMEGEDAEEVEDFGSFTYENNKIILFAEKDGHTFGLVFNKA